jgi:hypothetical protein
MQLINKLKGHSPVIGILGHRQVGKTTLLEQLTPRYFSLDSKREKLEAIADPEAYVERRAQGWVALDECQNVPDLFPAIKERIRLAKGRPGQFLLSGSVRFTGTSKIRESLTGRITNVELLPLSISEIEEAERSEAFSKLLEWDCFEQGSLERFFFSDKKSQTRKEKAIALYLEQGGLPGICFIREPKVRIERINSSLETILDTDLRTIVHTNIPYQQIRSLVQILARGMDEPIDLTRLSRQSGISRPTLRKLIYAFENIFILRLIRLEGAKRGFGFFFEDIAESNVMSDGIYKAEERLAHALWMNARVELSYQMGYPHEFLRFYSRSGKMSFCIRQGKSYLGVLCLNGPEPNRRELGISNSFLKHYKNSKVCLVHSDAKITSVDARVAILPFSALV